MARKSHKRHVSRNRVKPGRPTDNASNSLQRQARLAAIVIFAAMVLWMSLSWLGGKYNWPPRYAFLLDFAALAAFVWAFIVVTFAWLKARRGWR